MAGAWERKFTRVVDSLFRSHRHALGATYRPKAGGSLEVRLVLGHVDERQPVVSAPGARRVGFRCSVRRSEVAQPRRDDEIDLPALGPSPTRTVVVRDMQSDSLRLVWALDCDEVP